MGRNKLLREQGVGMRRLERVFWGGHGAVWEIGAIWEG